MVFSVESGGGGLPRISRRQLVEEPGAPAEAAACRKEEPLRAELRHFLECVGTRQTPAVPGEQGRRALAVALEIVQAIDDHRRRLGV
jgi:predicted dehydrogenase